MEEQVEQVKWEVQTMEWGEARSPQSEVMGPADLGSHSDPKRELLSSIGLFIGTGLLGFWFGIGATLGSKMFNSLEDLISR